MFLADFFGMFSLSAFSTWGFLMAFLFNVFIFSLQLKRDTTLFISSFVMMASYSISYYYFTWFSFQSSVYVDWALYDYATVATLGLVYFFIKKTTTSFLYLISGLIINSVFSLLMHLDIYILGNRESWVFWNIYTFTVNIIDLTMIVALIVDRDFLGLHKLKALISNFLISKHKVLKSKLL